MPLRRRAHLLALAVAILALLAAADDGSAAAAGAGGAGGSSSVEGASGAAHVRLSLSASGSVVVSWSLGEVSPVCVSFRRTSNCSADGPRDPSGDLSCDSPLPCPSQASGGAAAACAVGFCECGNGARAATTTPLAGACAGEAQSRTTSCNDECANLRARIRYAPSGTNLAAGNWTAASTTARWRGRLWSTVELSWLVPGREYVYQLSGASWSDFGPELRFRVPGGGVAGAGATGDAARVALFGDLAEGQIGLSLVEQAASSQPPADAVLHLGDIAGNLSDEESQKGDRFIDMVQPLASRVPYMTLPGDRDDLHAYHHFFHMPCNGSGASSPWYAFDLGQARVITLWTDAFLESGSHRGDGEIARRQLEWLKEELAAAAEGPGRPWLVVTGHRPLYCSMQQPTCGPEAARLREILEPLFHEHQVDLYLSAHMHAYERTYPVHNKTLCPHQPRKSLRVLRQPCATVYVVNGAAGVPPLQYDERFLPATWTAQRKAGFASFGELTIHNTTHLQYRQLGSTGGVIDEFWLRRARGKGEDVGEEDEEEDFLEAVWWLALFTAVVGGSMGFIRWVHADGKKRRDKALQELGIELSVLTGMPIKVFGTPSEGRALADDTDGTPGGGLH